MPFVNTVFCHLSIPFLKFYKFSIKCYLLSLSAYCFFKAIEELIKSGFPIGWREMGTERAVVGQLVAPPLPAQALAFNAFLQHFYCTQIFLKIVKKIFQLYRILSYLVCYSLAKKACFSMKNRLGIFKRKWLILQSKRGFLSKYCVKRLKNSVKPLRQIATAYN